MKARRRSAVLAWALCAAALVLTLVKFFVADVYRVDSGSMRPAIFGGASRDGGGELAERVLVVYDRSPDLRRYDLVVVAPQGAEEPMVKRVSALPGESVLLAGGDLFVDGRRPAPEERVVDVPVFDQEILDVRAYFQFKDDETVSWAEEAEEWRLDAAAVPAEADAGMMFFHKEMRDDYIDHDGRRVLGFRQVNDGILQCEVLLEQLARPDGRLRFQLLEEGDTFQALIGDEGGGRFRLSLRRRNVETLGRPEAQGRFDVLHEGPVELRPGTWHAVVFANVDNVLSFELDGRLLARADYEANVAHPSLAGSGKKSIGPRVGFGGEGCRARFRSIVILRDLYYTDSGRFAVTSVLTLGPDEVFVLGDNSAESSDSRHFGPVRTSEVVGRPVAVVWPLSRFRLLYGR